MKVTVMIFPKEGRSQMYTWDIEIQSQRRWMGKTINEALANGAMILSGASPKRVEFLQNLHDMFVEMRLA